MKKTLYILCLAMLCLFSKAVAQPSAVKKVQKAVFSLTTFDKNHNLLAQSCGVFVSSDGECISDFKPFNNAYSAEVTDVAGKTFKVERILGASEMHDIVRFKVKGATSPALLCGERKPEKGEKLFCVGTKKSKLIKTATIEKVETFLSQYSFYILQQNEKEGLTACPLVTERGEVIGLAQISSSSESVNSTDILYAKSLQTNSLSANDASLQKIRIPFLLPSEQNQARVALMMLSRDSLKYAEAAQDFIKAFPAEIDGYAALSQMEASAYHFEKADNLMQKAVATASNKAAAHFEYAKLIYGNITSSDSICPFWTLDMAMKETEIAQQLSPLAMYKHQAALIKYAQKDYAEAYNILMLLTNSDIKKADMYYEAAQCKLQMKAPDEEVLVLLDSAISNVDSIAIASSAGFFFTRGQVYDRLGRFRDAVLDYSRYQILMNNRVNDVFFYTRYVAEVNAKLYKQALIDIQNCYAINPDPEYLAELSSLQFRVNLIDEAIASATFCTENHPDYAAAYVILALAQEKKGDKKAAKQNLLKAKELGHPKAEKLLQKYK